MAREDHKHDVVTELLETYPDLPFVLVGDAGQDDPAIYTRVAREHPGRIRAVYIRDVISGEEDVDISDARRRLEQVGVPVIQADETVVMAEDALGRGLISEAGLEDVRREAAHRTADGHRP